MRLHTSFALVGLMTSSLALAVPITAAPQILGGGVAPDILNDVADAGDVNGDGIHDMILGDPLDGPGGNIAGSVWIDFGGTPGLALPGAVHFPGTNAGDMFGHSVASGDFNCDGRPDLVVGIPGSDMGGPDSGAVQVFLGPFFGGTIPAGAADYTFRGEAPGDQAGHAVDFLTDRDGDGCDDLLIGAPYQDAMGLPDSGAAYIIGSATTPLGGTSLTSLPPIIKISGDMDGGTVGFSVSDAGDHNGDGRPDVVLGAPRYDGPGAVFVAFTGISIISPVLATPISSVSTIYRGELDGDAFGWAVDGGRDLDQDGLDDIMVGAPRAHSTAVISPFPSPGSAGAAYFFSAAWAGPGPGAVASATLGTKWTGTTSGAGFGWDVSFLYDVNGDGREDMAVSEPWFQVTPNAMGRVHGLLSNSYTIVPSFSAPPTGPTIDAVAGFMGVGVSIDRSIDNDGDGRPDPLIGFYYRPAQRNGLASF